MKKSETKFMAWDWDDGKFKFIPSNNVVEAIHIAWNYEFDVYEVETENIIFSGREDNAGNSDWLEPYGIRMIDDGGLRVLQNIETGEIYRADWQKVKDLYDFKLDEDESDVEMEKCDVCDGSGFSVFGNIPCGYCEGTGEVESVG